VGGVEAAMSYTEYNLSQVDFSLLSATVNGGADLHFGGLRLGARVGLAPFATPTATRTASPPSVPCTCRFRSPTASLFA